MCLKWCKGHCKLSVHPPDHLICMMKRSKQELWQWPWDQRVLQISPNGQERGGTGFVTKCTHHCTHCSKTVHQHPAHWALATPQPISGDRVRGEHSTGIAQTDSTMTFWVSQRCSISWSLWKTKESGSSPRDAQRRTICMKKICKRSWGWRVGMVRVGLLEPIILEKEKIKPRYDHVTNSQCQARTIRLCITDFCQKNASFPSSGWFIILKIHP